MTQAAGISSYGIELILPDYFSFIARNVSLKCGEDLSYRYSKDIMPLALAKQITTVWCNLVIKTINRFWGLGLMNGAAQHELVIWEAVSIWSVIIYKASFRYDCSYFSKYIHSSLFLFWGCDQPMPYSFACKTCLAVIFKHVLVVTNVLWKHHATDALSAFLALYYRNLTKGR